VKLEGIEKKERKRGIENHMWPSHYDGESWSCGGRVDSSCVEFVGIWDWFKGALVVYYSNVG
jgi:hypothetical protein